MSSIDWRGDIKAKDAWNAEHDIDAVVAWREKK